MSNAVPGVHESLITAELQRALARIAPEQVQREGLDPTEADRFLAGHVASVLERALAAVGGDDRERVAQKVALANAVIDAIGRSAPRGASADDTVDESAELLLGIARTEIEPGGVSFLARPGVPLSSGALLVNGRGQPRIGHEIDAEMKSADRVDLLCAFLKWHGLLLIEDAIEDLISRGGRLRVITTTYIGATDQRAVDRLVELGAEVKVSYDTLSTRLHAKAWNFQRESGANTAYVGSSNLSRTALLDGLEWNVRVSGLEQPAVMQTVQATFEEYWQDSSFEEYDPSRDRDRLRNALQRERGGETSLPLELTALEVAPRPYQREVLEQLDVERTIHGQWKNLIVMATGTGKTVVAALDYRRLQTSGAKGRLLFVAHREEILRQSRSVFRQVLRDGAFGELLGAGEHPQAWDYVFASVQSLARIDLTRLAPDRFDVVIVDEFHHASAPSYRRLLEYLRPRVLVGLTATPERSDGLDVRHYFDGRVSVDLRLWDALDRNLLTPFHYFGSHDDVDLSSIRWSRGAYDQAQLEGVYTGNDARVRLILQQVQDKVADPGAMRALGFCVSVAHARYMAQRFQEAGIPSLALTGNSPDEMRRRALTDLDERRVNVIFTVDLFNEGIDLPTIDTVLFLRPTESATIFLQQLGRGLRLAQDKPCLTVLDFIGTQSAQFRFDERFRALTGASRKELAQQIESGFPLLPAGCRIQLDRVAKQVVLTNVRSALRLPVSKLRQELQSIGDVPLADFLAATGFELEDVYRPMGSSWAQLRREAGFDLAPANETDATIGRRIGRLLHIDDPRRFSMLERIVEGAGSGVQASTTESRLRALVATDLLGPDSAKLDLDQLHQRIASAPSRQLELRQLLGVLRERQPRVTTATSTARVPLQVHARYSRDEVLTGFGVEDPVREGVKWVQHENADIFFVTLTKVESHYSPTTMYADRAISPELFQWESQSTTSVGSRTGQRYVNQRKNGTTVHLFIRQTKAGVGGLGTPPYLYAGTMQYVSHSGDRPVRFVWHLDRPLPTDVFQMARLAS